MPLEPEQREIDRSRTGIDALPTVPDFPIVGIGASAGGIQALITFFEHMPAESGMAFVVVLHLSPLHDSKADEILQRTTRMAVRQVKTLTKIEKNQIYLISPSSSLEMVDGELHVEYADRPHGAAVAIDLFLRTLADAHGPRAACVVLSGTGSDGSSGIARIKDSGGITIAQQVDDAEYGEMPANAIATGMVDFVLPVTQIPGKLVEVWQNARNIQLPSADGESLVAHDASVSTPLSSSMPSAAARAKEALREVLTILHARTGHDFHHYKRATILRRIERRLQVNALPNLPAYRDFFNDNDAETAALLKDLLIGVTNFFRDGEAFDALEQDIVPELFTNKQPGEQVRAWVAACSSGEEVYSIGMLLSECAATKSPGIGVQLFATDIDDRAIDVARLGVYSPAILTDLTPKRINEFFSVAGNRYTITKALREKVLFASHNLLRDPPFSRLDFISCRNLLIYLDRTVQRQILQTFHFALNPGGILFLGNAESAEVAEDLFSPIDKKNRIYRAKSLAIRTKRKAVTNSTAGRFFFNVPPAPVKQESRPPRTSPVTLHQRLRAQIAPPSILVDREGDILHASEDAAVFLRFAGGEPTHHLLSLIVPDLRVEVRTALYQVVQNGGHVEIPQVRFAKGDGHAYVNIAMHRFQDGEGADVVLLTFDESELVTIQRKVGDDGTDGTHRLIVGQLEQELQRAKEQLLLSVEQSSLSNEELKASNEELQAIVEELRSASEELETSKEELQSVNEELTTVNGELESKVSEADKANDDLENLIVATGIATIFVDRKMRIKRYTAPAVGLFNLIKSDIGRPLLDLTHRLNYPQLADDARAAFDQLKLTEREVSTPQGEWFLARLLPYRTLSDRIEGAVLTLIDVTARRAAQMAAIESEDRLKLAALATDDYGIIVQDVDGAIVSWNHGAERMFGFCQDEAIGQPITLIFAPNDVITDVAGEERLKAMQDGRMEDERWHVRKDGSDVYCSGVTTLINTDSFKGFAKIVRDVTDKKSVESAQQLQLQLERTVREQAEAAVRLKDEFFAVLSHELKNPLNLIHVKADLLSRSPQMQALPLVQDAADAIKRSVISQAKIIDDLLDLSRVRTGKLSLNVAAFDLSGTLGSLIEVVSADALAGGIEVTLKGCESPLIIHADAVRVEQMLWNLMRNALKFTQREGLIDVSLSADHSEVCVEVRDNGRGIDPVFLPRIFDMFTQVEPASRRVFEGLGIGLSLVRQLAEMHGGRIEAFSEGPGKGARFRLYLPTQSIIPHEVIIPVRPAGSILKGLRVLLVDDAIESLDALRVLLEIEGARVHALDSGQLALEALVETQYDLLISDLAMPNVDGFQLARALRVSKKNAHIPAIAVTGFGRKQDQVHALKSGFNAHLSKPVPLQKLLDAIEGHLPGRSAS